jgi:hypothetical protein
MQAVTGLVERHPRDGAWISHYGPARPPGACQSSGRVVAVERCADPACRYCSADRVDAWQRRREFPVTSPNPDRPPG